VLLSETLGRPDKLGPSKRLPGLLILTNWRPQLVSDRGPTHDESNGILQEKAKRGN